MMVRQCYICKKMKHNFPNLTFHRFPIDRNLRRLWYAALGFHENKVLPKSSEICSNHFKPESFIIKPSGRRYLREDAIPLSFDSESITSIISSSDSVEGSPPKKVIILESREVMRHAIVQATSSELDSDSPSGSPIKCLPLTQKSVDSVGIQRGIEELMFPSTASVETTQLKEIFSEDPGPSGYQGSLVSISKRRKTEDLSASQEQSGVLRSMSSSTTVTASETEEQMIKMIAESDSDLSSTAVGPKSEFRGKLALVSLPKKRKHYVGDITSDDFSSPKKAKRHFQQAKEKIMIQKKKIRSLQDTVRRLRKRIRNLNDLLKLLREKLYISESSESTIKASLPDGAATEIFERFLQGPKKQKYTPALRSFALTLCFYSPRAYNFIRKTFNRTLPHEATIRKWYQSVDGSPGFTKESLNVLKLKHTEANEKGQKVLCNLVLDEMSIRKQVEWTGHKFTGYIDVGTNIDSDELPEAKEILVFMIVCINSCWKIPVGYFLIDGLSASEKAALLSKCLEFVHESGIIVTSLTFDGAPVNFSMATKLGANFSNILHLKTFFNHPLTGEKVFIFLDACHMMKLVRNCFGSNKILEVMQKGQVDWKYIEKLVEFQTTEQIHPATKLRHRHLQWTREKMKVRIATQTLSKSVSDALLYLNQDLHLVDFQNCEATANFLLLFNNIFDIFNSKNNYAKYRYKKPFSPATASEFIDYLENFKTYIHNLNLAGRPVLTSKRKTGFLGFLISIESLIQMYKMYVTEKKLMKYILTYKLSQDHLELFFGSIRSRGGYNNNPTARQFEAAYKRLTVRCEVKAADTGNVLNLDNTHILYCSSSSKLTTTDENTDVQESEDYLNFLDTIKENLNECQYNSDVWRLTDYVEDVTTYIAGFVVKCLKKCLTCSKCKLLVEGTQESQLQLRKQYKKLTSPSNLIKSICHEAEKYFRFFNKTTGVFNKNIKNLLSTLIMNTIQLLPTSIISYFGDHFFDDELLESHSLKLIKLTLKIYFDIRIHHETKKKMDLAANSRIRSVLSKTILFKNQ